MATVAVLRFDSADGAELALDRVRELQRQQLIDLHDAAVVSWPEGSKSPGTKPIANLATTRALGGVFWGMLFGLLFFTPLLGMGGGVASVAMEGPFAAYGIDDRFTHRVREAVKEGTSAIFLMTGDAVIEVVLAALKSSVFDIIATNLSRDQERLLREALAHN
jgi:uncharacterized membrane protein